jgi:cytochrome c oxidase assembly factor 1
MLPRRLARPSLLQSFRTSALQNARRTLIAAPKAGDGPLMSRRSDRDLPSISSTHKFLKTFPIFLLVLGASTLAIFNYQKSSSSVVTSALYALRVNASAREALGDEIYFRDKIPWIFGTIDQLHGRIDINFGVKGTRRTGVMRFKSERNRGMEFVSFPSLPTLA